MCPAHLCGSSAVVDQALRALASVRKAAFRCERARCAKGRAVAPQAYCVRRGCGHGRPTKQVVRSRRRSLQRGGAISRRRNSEERRPVPARPVPREDAVWMWSQAAGNACFSRRMTLRPTPGLWPNGGTCGLAPRRGQPLPSKSFLCVLWVSAVRTVFSCS